MEQKYNDLIDFLRDLPQITQEGQVENMAEGLYDLYVKRMLIHMAPTVCALFADIILDTDKKETDPLGVYVINFEGVIAYCEANSEYKKNYKFIKRIGYLQDIILTEYQRNTSYGALYNYADTVINRVSVTEENLNQLYAKNTKKVKNLEKTIISEVVAVLGIFVSIVVACFGTISIIGNIALLLSEGVPLYKVLIAFFVVAIILLNILAILTYFIGRLCDKSISASCKAPSCAECKGDCNRISRIWKKHYPIVLINILLVVLIVLTFCFLPSIEKKIDQTYNAPISTSASETEVPTTEPVESTYETDGIVTEPELN